MDRIGVAFVMTSLRDGNDTVRYHSQQYDITLKDITAETGITLVSDLLKIPIMRYRVIDSELVVVERRELDYVFEVNTPDETLILHLEFQSKNDAEMPKRMLEYHGRLYRHHGKTVVSVVVYLGSAPL